MTPRLILHADMDAFYAAIEQLDHPELRGKPILVGSPSGRGVVTTASYEARPYGVGSAMPMAVAQRKCPTAIVIPPRFQRYVEVSRQVMDVFHTFSPNVEPLSLDEAFLDMTGCERLFGTPENIAAQLKSAVFKATGGLTVSVGLAATKYVAKVASEFRKPNGTTWVPERRTLEFLHRLPVASLWGAGPKVQSKLRAHRLETIGDVAACKEAYLVQLLGSMGAHFYRLSRGIDPRPVVGARSAKSVGAERTLSKDVSGRNNIWPHVLFALDEIAYRLRKRGIGARGIRLKLKSADFRLLTRQGVLEHATDSVSAMSEVAQRLLDEFDLSLDYRLVGAAAFRLTNEPAAVTQMDLFGAPQGTRDTTQRRLDQALDQVKSKFGTDAVKRGTALMGRNVERKHTST